MYLVQPEISKNRKTLTLAIHSLKLHKSNLNPSEKCKPKLISKTYPQNPETPEGSNSLKHPNF
jgi:hypothetical protein